MADQEKQIAVTAEVEGPTSPLKLIAGIGGSLIILSLRKHFQNEKRAKKKGAGQNLIFLSVVNAVGGNDPNPAMPSQEPTAEDPR